MPQACRPPGPRGFTRADLLMVVGIVLFVAILVLPHLGRDAGQTKDRQRCAAHLKQLGMGALLYAADYGGFFPNHEGPEAGAATGRGNWRPLNRLEYLGESHGRPWVCPAVKEERVGSSSGHYRYVGSGRRDDNVHAAVVTIGYDASGNHPENAWMNALFIDGHVEGAVPNGDRQVRFITHHDADGTAVWHTGVWNLNHH